MTEELKVLKYKFIYGSFLSTDELLLLIQSGDRGLARSAAEVLSMRVKNLEHKLLELAIQAQLPNEQGYKSVAISELPDSMKQTIMAMLGDGRSIS